MGKRYLPGRRVIPKVRKHNIVAVDLCGKSKLSSLESFKIGWCLGHMSIPQKWKYEVPQKWKKVFIWYKVLIEISQEVEASSPEVEKGFFTW